MWLGFLLAGSFAAATAQAPQHPAGASTSQPAHTSRVSPGQAQATPQPEWTALLTKQAAAVESNSLDEIESTSRLLNASALRELAKMELLGGDAWQAAALLEDSLALNDSTETRLERASVLLRLGDTSAAEQESLAIVQAEPQSAAAWSLRGCALQAVHNEQGAKAAFQKARQLNPDPEAARAAERATLDPSTSLTPTQRNDLRAKEAELRRVLANSYNDLGTAEARQQQYGPALTNFEQAERWQEPESGLLRNLGVAAFRMQNYAEATRALGAYLRTNHDDRLRLMLAMSHFSMGHFAEAAASFDQVSAQAMQDPRAAYSWAFSLARTGQQQRANSIANQLSTLALPPDAMDLVCHVYMDTEAYEQSLACLRKVAAAEPSLPLVHYGEGESLIRLDRPAEAIPELRAELALSPANANVESSLAFALLQTSQKDEARKLLEQAVATDPEHARAQYQLGKLILDEGNAAEAVPHLEVSERSDPSPDYVHYQLGTAYRKLGRSADAERELKAYREIKDKARAAATVPQPSANQH